MTHYPIYLEVAGDGRCMAHVPDLPGCIVCARTRDEALERLPETIGSHLAWLGRHGEPVPQAGEALEIEIAAEYRDGGPFDPGDTAALLPPDGEPVSREEMDIHFRLMGHARADLLALTRDLPAELLDWQPGPDAFTIRQVLRHVGNAEEWYVSRLVPPGSLPPEWEHDEDLAIFEFLEMERRTAIARLQQLTAEELEAVFRPAHWTSHPEEAWTARKALRRALEHEREHTAQVRETLDLRRCHLLACLAADRAGLVEQLVGLDGRTLSTLPITGGWTVKDLLAHVAAWDRWQHQAMARMLLGQEPDWASVEDVDTANAATVAAWRDRKLGDVVAELQAARAEWLAWLEGLPLEEFFRPRTHGGWDWTFATVPLRVQWEHDAEHAAQIAAWRQAHGLGGKSGPKEILVAALVESRRELLAAASLVPEAERESRAIVGKWTLKDLLGHVADWEWLDLEGLRHMAQGRPPQVEHVVDIDAWNEAHAQARRSQPWARVWNDLQASRSALLDVLAAMDDDGLARTFPFPWGVKGTSYEWACVVLQHSRGHARELREWARGSEDAREA